MAWIDRIFPPRPARPFHAWQIEITTRCALRCLMCVKEASTEWERRDMSPENFRKLLPLLRQTENVVLEGWGESLLHPDLTQFVRWVKAEGARTGFVTSGEGFREETLKALIAAGIDFVGFSLSGAKATTHERIRIHSDFSLLLDTIRRFQNCAGASPRPPRIHIVYLLLQMNAEELPDLIPLAKNLAVRDIHVIHNTLAVTTWQDAQRVFSRHDNPPEPDLANRVREAQTKARRLKIRLQLPALTPQTTAVCSENPLRNLYVSSAGQVSPCVFLHPPLISPCTRIFHGSSECRERLSFGNLFEESFTDLWKGEACTAFRRRFLLRRRTLMEGQRAFHERKQLPGMELPDPPEPCRLCPKILGG